ncbi:MAG TPA: FHA domain-containing protein [Acidimicrobiales bacterium]
MPDPVLTLLKYVFLAILYLFFLRVLRAVWIELREPKPAPVPDSAGGATSPPLARPLPETPAGTAQRLGPEKLVVREPAELSGVEFLLSDEMTVGRAAGCGVALPDDTFVSQLHARVFRRDGDLFVEDLGSTNGTYLNGKKVSAASVMRKGDRVQVGRTTLELQK